MAARNLRFAVSPTAGEVSASLLMPKNPQSLFVMAHGAGAGMRHAFMEALVEKLAELSVATFRYQFPYIEKGSKRPDSETVLTASVRAAVAAATQESSGVSLFAAGKSMGGRMTSLAESKQPLPGIRGLIFFGFPLHPPGKPAVERGAHLFSVQKRMLFLQGSRDSLADIELLKPLCRKLGVRAELFIIEGGDHSFRMLRSSGRSDDQVLGEVAAKAASWATGAGATVTGV